ncbi:hypothetical protein GCM10009098_26310 [Rheinheimera aquimaris]|uniref:DUF2496 domain-containing protein n=1 Tax=Rheinheimera aquimaris TaxID=412437 RepID=A0ABN1E1G0_9GAMM
MNNALDQAPEHVKLAVDLIMLLEQHQLDTETVLRALTIVQQDFAKKRDLGGNPTSHIPAHTS